MPLSGSLSLLKQSAVIAQQETFVPWVRGTGFSGSFLGRLYPIDRFKSIYPRPVQRETLGVMNSVSLPASQTIKHSATGYVYAVSSLKRCDVENDEVYDSLLALHRVEAGSLVRYSTLGSGDDLGPLTAETPVTVYANAELRTEYKLPDTHRASAGNFLVTTPEDSGLTIQAYDEITLNGKTYVLTEIYGDSGFALARADDRPSSYENLIYYLTSGVSGGYNPSTLAPTAPTTVSRIFSATVTDYDVQTNGEVLLMNGIMAYVRKSSVGFDFSIGAKFLRGSITYKITRIVEGEDKLQLILYAERLS